MSDFLRWPDSYPGKTIIAYDTVGYRSGLFVEKMHRQGICMSNLKGGLRLGCTWGQNLRQRRPGDPAGPYLWLHVELCSRGLRDGALRLP